MKTQRSDNTEFVIRALSRNNNANDIIMALCDKRGLRWEEAANFVSRVEREHARSIRARQRPLLILWSTLMCIFGVGMIIIGIHSLLSGQLVPLTLTVFIVEVDLPNGGQVVPLLLGAGSLLGGLAGIWIEMHK